MSSTQTSKKQETGETTFDSSQSSPPISDLALKFETKEFEYFDVEVAIQGDDVVYHFWPPKGGSDFVPPFGKSLEDGFKAVLPLTAEVEADYISKEEAAVVLRYGESPDADAPARETYYVKVIGWASNPMVDQFLKNKVFREIHKAVEEKLNDSHEKGQE